MNRHASGRCSIAFNSGIGQEPMGAGKVMFTSNGSASWSHVVPESISDIRWQVACEAAELMK
jgi:hypothetical protein